MSRAEFDEINRRFQIGLYEIESEDAVFDLDEYSILVERTVEEVQQLRKRQHECAALELEKCVSSLSVRDVNADSS